jgi:proteasome lid subunit RPN8/RPN11
MTIILRSKDFETIVSHCKEEEPIEACGIIAGQIRDHNEKIVKEVLHNEKIVKEVLKIYLCKNELQSSVEYKIGAEEQLRIFSEINDEDLDLLGFYHSHPNTSSNPSQIDEKRANYIGYSYLIISLHPTKISSWILEQKRSFTKEEINII